MQLTLQTSDHDAIGSLPAKWRTLVNARILTLKQLAAGQLTKAGAMERLHVSRATLDRMILGVKDLGWAALVPKYKGVGSTSEAGLSAEFIDFWKTLVEGNQRKTAPAYRLLVRLWRARQPFTFQEVKHDFIPGYQRWPGWPNIPNGWGGKGRNLYRHQPKKIELTALRHGLGRAKALYGTKTLGTRVGLWHLSHVAFDDIHLDLKAHILESKKLIRPLQLGALDVLSGSRFAYGTVPQLWREDGTRASLSEKDMRFMMCAVLRYQGVSARGTTWLGEHGTAVIRGHERDILKRVFGDTLQFGDSGMLGKIQAITGMGDGRGGGGNPNHKAWLESLHNLIHNEMAFAPGQLGHGRDAPEFMGVIERHDEGLLKLAGRLPMEVMRNLKLKTLEWHTQLMPYIAEVLKIIDRRDDHNMEGWAELGFITRDYRLMAESAEWINETRLLEMPMVTRSAILAAADADQRCWQPRKLSPHEVFERGRAAGEIIETPDSVIAEILYQDLAQPRKLDHDGKFHLFDREVAAAELEFDGRVTAPNGRPSRLVDGETYEVVLSPFDVETLWVYNARGAFLGTCRLTARHNRADEERSKAAFKYSAEQMAERLTPTRRRNAQRTVTETERNRHNRGVIDAHAQAKADFTRRATAALTNAISTDNDHDTQTNNTDETDPRKLWR
jgi:hypothetical protein